MAEIGIYRERPAKLVKCARCGKRVELVNAESDDERLTVRHPLMIERVFERHQGAHEFLTIIDTVQLHRVECLGGKGARGQAREKRQRAEREPRLF